MNNERTLNIFEHKGKRVATVVGVQYGYVWQLQVIAENDKFIIIKVPGGPSWKHIGCIAYSSPWLLVFKKNSESIQPIYLNSPSGKRTIEATELFSKDYTRETRRDIYERAYNIFNEKAETE